MESHKIRRLAREILAVGDDKIWMDPNQTVKIEEALTKEDVRALIVKRLIKKKPPVLQSKGRARILHAKHKKRRKRGQGKRTGTKKARMQKRLKWVQDVRAQRKKLRELREKHPEFFEKIAYSNVYNKIKGRFFKGKKYLEAFLVEAK